MITVYVPSPLPAPVLLGSCLYTTTTETTGKHSYLLRDLTEVVNEPDGRSLLQWVIDIVDIYLPFIKKMMEDIYSFDRSRPLLFVAKDEVNPLVQMGTHIITFQSLQG